MTQPDEQEAEAYEELVEVLVNCIGPKLPPPAFADLTMCIMQLLAEAYQDGYELGFKLGTEKRRGSVN